MTFTEHEGSVDQLCWHKTNPELLCTAGGDKTVRIWDVRQIKCCSTINTKGKHKNVFIVSHCVFRVKENLYI